MPQPNRGRSTGSPLSVKLSERERRELEEKAKRAGVRLSDGARAAIAAWDPQTKAAPSAPSAPQNIVKTGINTRG